MAFDENVPVSSNQISDDLTAINANWEYVIHGDGTAGRVFRSVFLRVENGTNANTIKCQVTSKFNGDTVASTDNIGKGATVGDFSLDAAGETLTWETSGITGTLVGIVAAYISHNTTTNTHSHALVEDTAGDITIDVYTDASGTILDLTTIASGLINVDIVYVTSS